MKREFDQKTLFFLFLQLRSLTKYQKMCKKS